MSETPQIDLQKLVKELLDKALKDIKASEILYRENLKDLAIFHLEQASEKILKAYFIGYQRKPLRYLLEMYEVAETTGTISAIIPNKYKSLHQTIKDIIKQLADPKNLGHDLAGFLDKKLRNLYEDICKVDFEGYLKFLLNGFIAALHILKPKFINGLRNKGINVKQAENEVNSSISFVAQLFNQLITYIENSNLKNIICNEEVRESISIKELSKEIKENSEPCIYDSVEIYKSIDKEIRDLLEKSLRDENETIAKITSSIIMYFRDNNTENSKTYIESLLYEVVSPIFVLPLHLCLYKYYDISRYPGGKIPGEEYKIIPETIELLKEVHKTVEHVAQVFPEFGLRLD